MAKLSCALFTTFIVPSAEADCAAPRARIKPGIASVESSPMIAITNSMSISVKPYSFRAAPTFNELIIAPLSIDNYWHSCHFAAAVKWPASTRRGELSSRQTLLSH